MNSPSPPLTGQARALMQAALLPGDRAIDATCGMGRDTVMLARAVGPLGKVLAIDVQEIAVKATAAALAAENLADRVVAIRASHGDLDQLVVADWKGRVGAVTFNLGYLPGGDHGITTAWRETRRALMVAPGLLRPGGVLTVIAYTGHPGGAEEKEGVERELRLLDPEKWVLEVHQPEKGRRSPPWLYVVRRIGGARPCNDAPT
ncbi:MAG: class I SAM-dependent methyltransferase [Planctomycetota bacterium]